MSWVCAGGDPGNQGELGVRRRRPRTGVHRRWPEKPSTTRDPCCVDGIGLPVTWQPAVSENASTPSLLSMRKYYRKRGSASYIVHEVLLVRERERDTDRQRRKWRHHCRAKIGDEFTLSLAKNSHLAMSYTFPCQKFAPFDSPFTLPISPFLNGHHCGAEIRIEFSLSVAKKLRPLCSNSLKWRDCSFYRKNESN